MDSERIERYIVDRRFDGVELRMRQARNSLGVAAVAGGAVYLTWWFGPYGPRPGRFEGWFYWIWSGLIAVFGILGLIGAMVREDWIITQSEIVLTSSFATWQNSPRRVPRAGPLGIRVEHRPGKGEGSIFPWTVHFLDEQRNVCGLKLELQRSRSVDRLLEALRAVFPLDVDDPAASRRPAR